MGTKRTLMKEWDRTRQWPLSGSGANPPHPTPPHRVSCSWPGMCRSTALEGRPWKGTEAAGLQLPEELKPLWKRSCWMTNGKTQWAKSSTLSWSLTVVLDQFFINDCFETVWKQQADVSISLVSSLEQKALNRGSGGGPGRTQLLVCGWSHFSPSKRVAGDLA